MWYHHISYIQFQLYPSDLRWWYLGFSSVPFGLDGRGQGLLRVSPSAARYNLGLWAKTHKVTWNTNLPMTIVTMTIHMMWIWCEYDMNMFFFHTLINYHIHHIHSMNMDDHQIWTNPVFHLMIEIMSPNFWMSWARNFSIFSAEHLLNADSIQTGASPIHSPYGQPVLEQKDPKKLKPQSASDL